MEQDFLVHWGKSGRNKGNIREKGSGSGADSPHLGAGYRCPGINWSNALCWHQESQTASRYCRTTWWRQRGDGCLSPMRLAWEKRSKPACLSVTGVMNCATASACILRYWEKILWIARQRHGNTITVSSLPSIP